MKLKSILIMLISIITINTYAQAPDFINYQAIVRDINNTVIANQAVTVKFSVKSGIPNGAVVFQESHAVTTNSHGLINLKIGSGVAIVGTLGAIDWSLDSYFLTTEIDPAGGTNFTLNGISQLVSVPYALHAKTVENINDADADPTNEIELPVGGTNGQVLQTDGNGVYTWVNQTVDTDTDTQLTEVQVDAFVANNGYLTSFTEVDGDPTNEIELPVGGTNGQVLKTDGSGNYAWVNQTVDTDTDTQLTEAQVDAFVANNGYLTSFTEVDGDPTNEIELPTGGTNGQVLKTDGSGNYAWVNQTVDTDTQLDETAVDAFVANNGYLTSEADADPTNEIQTLALAGNVLSISGGNSVTLPANSGYTVGQHLDGGIIIFVDSSGLHGLIVSETDLGSYAYQSDGPNQVPGATSYYDGESNTTALAAAAGTYDAADACAAHTGGGFNDWYLPSYAEFIVIYSNMHLLSGFDFNAGIYWTSTTSSVFGGTSAVSYYLTGSANFTQSVGTVSLVRPIRKF